MCNLDMERQIHRSTDIDIRPHLKNLSEELGFPTTGEGILEEDFDGVEKAIDFIEDTINLRHQAQ